MDQKVVPTNLWICHEAAGNLAYLLSIIRCKEELNDEERANVYRVIGLLNGVVFQPSSTHPVERLACAIQRQERWGLPGAISTLRNNPGGLDLCGQMGARRAPAGSIHPDVAIFHTAALGITALFRQLWRLVAEGLTVRQIVEEWAPPAGNNETPRYLVDVLSDTGLLADIPVLDLLPPLQNL